MKSASQVLMILMVVMLVVGAIYGVAQATITQDFQFSGFSIGDGDSEYGEDEGQEDDDDDEYEGGDELEDDD